MPTYTSRCLFLIALIAAQSGCAGYYLGTRSLYPPHIHTIHVRVVESDGFRRHLGERLTEAICKKTELQTPFDVVHLPHADSTLTGRIVAETKWIVSETGTDEPRELQLTFDVVMTWTDRRGAIIGHPATIPVPAILIDASMGVYQVPEVGQSTVTAQQAMIERLAQEIVGQLETPW